MTESIVDLEHHDEARELFGLRDDNLRQLCTLTGATVVLRGSQVRITGEDAQVQQCLETLQQWRSILRERRELTPGDVVSTLPPTDPVTPHNGHGRQFNSFAEPSSMIHADHHSGTRHHSGAPTGSFAVHGLSDGHPASRLPADLRSGSGRDRVGTIRPKTDGQKIYMEAMRQNELVFADGPAGCGKTYLAVALALEALRSEQVRKIVLVRPAVEAGEKLGFLPGDMFAKVNPFLRPLLDAIYDMLDHEQVRRYMANDVIEIAPLAFMRGRTLNDTFIILDEAQNTTCTQMKMFLTRMGTNSRIVVTGDSTQIDLEKGVASGLKDGIRRLSSIRGVAIVRLTGQDIVRHRLVREIVSAYETDSGQ